MTKRTLFSLVALAAFAFFVVRTFNSMAAPEQLHLPQQLGGLPILSQTGNNTEMMVIHRVKPADIRVLKEGSAIYEKDGTRVFFWVGVVKNYGASTQFLREAMSAANQIPGWTGIKEVSLTGRPALTAQEGKIVHTIFIDGPSVYYFTTQAGNKDVSPEALADEILRHPINPSGG